MRVQEIDGFVAGLFGREDRIDLTERAHRALDDLAKMRALFVAVQDVATDETKATTLRDLQTSSSSNASMSARTVPTSGCELRG